MMENTLETAFAELMGNWRALEERASLRKELELDSLQTEKLFCESALLLAQMKSEIEFSAFKEAIRPLKELFGKSDFVSHCQNWPLGYPGDFQVVERIMSPQNDATPYGIGFLIEDYVIRLSSAAQQHRNKILAQSQVILHCVHSTSNPTILSLGAGPAHDLRWIQDFLKDKEMEIDLVDIDKRALRHAESHLGALDELCRYEQADILNYSPPEGKEYALILAGGLFDYIRTADLIALLERLYSQLAPGGRIFFTNMDVTDRWKLVREYLMNWKLQLRSEADLVEVCQQAGIPMKAVTIRREGTGTTFLVDVLK